VREGLSRVPRLILVFALILAASCRGGRLSGADGELRVSPSELTLPDTFVGYSHTAQLTLTNTGASARQATLTVAAPWFIDAAQLQVPGGSAVEVPVHFRPLVAGAHPATLTVTSDLGAQSAVALTAEAKEVPACAAPSDCHSMAFDPESGTCFEEALPDGASCGAGNTCIVSGVCNAGRCMANLKDCDDHNACTRDSCSPESGCLHEDVSQACPTPANNCSVAVCNPATGCGTTAADDGTHCGPSDCNTAQVCVTGACVARAVPEGDVCASASLCQGPGVCHAKSCVREPAAPLAPAWTYSPPEDRSMLFDGLVDLDGNTYFVEWTHDGKYTDLVSLDLTGSERWRVAIPTCGQSGCGYYLHLALDTDGQRIFLASYLHKRLSARSMTNGRPLWDRDTTIGLPINNPTPTGAGSFSIGEPLLLGSGNLVGVQVSEGYTDHWSYVVLFDRQTGTPAPWRVSKKGHSYGIGSWGGGELALSSANCWAPAGEVASFSKLGNQTGAQFVTGNANAFSADGVWVSSSSASALVPVSGAPIPVMPKAGESFPYTNGALISGTRLLVSTGNNTGRYTLNDYDTTTGQVRWRVPLPASNALIGQPDVALLSDGSVFAAAPTMTNTGLVSVFDKTGTETLSCPLPAMPTSPVAVRSGVYFAQALGKLMAFSLPGLDTATVGWVSQRGSPAHDHRAR
jgi:hypothetical protein